MSGWLNNSNPQGWWILSSHALFSHVILPCVRHTFKNANMSQRHPHG